MTITASRTAKIPHTTDTRQIVTAFNREIASLREQIRQLQRQPKFTGPIDMGGHRITNVGRTLHQNDVPGRQELIDKAMYDNGAGQHVARSPIIATTGIRSKQRPKEPDELATVRVVKDLIVTGGGGGNFVTTDTFQIVTGHKVFESINFAPTDITGLLNGNVNNDVSLGIGAFFIVRSGPSAAFGITSFTTTETTRDGRVIVLYNATAFNMTIVDQNNTASGSIVNRVKCLATGQANITTSGNGAVVMVYDSTALRWVVIATNL